MQQTTDSDSDVLSLVHHGDIAGALRRLIECHGAAVHRYCATALRDTSLADDVYQQVFLQAFRGLARFEGRSQLRTWLLAIARHCVLTAVDTRSRAHARAGSPTDLADVPDPGLAPDESIYDGELRAALAASLHHLEPRARDAVLLRFHDGLTYPQIAEIYGEPPAALYTRVNRALHVLRKSIEARIGAAAAA